MNPVPFSPTRSCRSASQPASRSVGRSIGRPKDMHGPSLNIHSTSSGLFGPGAGPEQHSSISPVQWIRRRFRSPAQFSPVHSAAVQSTPQQSSPVRPGPVRSSRIQLVPGAIPSQSVHPSASQRIPAYPSASQRILAWPVQSHPSNRIHPMHPGPSQRSPRSNRNPSPGPCRALYRAGGAALLLLLLLLLGGTGIRCLPHAPCHARAHVFAHSLRARPGWTARLLTRLPAAPDRCACVRVPGSMGALLGKRIALGRTGAVCLCWPVLGFVVAS